MSPTEIRQKLHQQIDQLPSDLLQLVAEFLDFLKFKQTTTPALARSISSDPQDSEPILTGSTGADLLQFAGTWQGDDFEDCLQDVYTNRTIAEF